MSAAYTTKYPTNPTETHAAVLVPLCNLNDNPGLLFEVRGKLRAHSGEVRWGVSTFLSPIFTQGDQVSQVESSTRPMNPSYTPR